jgi:hypothetical protein
MTNGPNRWRRGVIAAVAVLVCVASVPMDAVGQAADPASGGPGQHGGRRHGRPTGDAATTPSAPGPSVKPEPLQRLDAGALLCQTEQELQLHQAAIIARLNGKEGDEPAGCHVVQSMTAVSVVDRHGPARTEVKSATETGWTDSLVRNP